MLVLSSVQCPKDLNRISHTQSVVFCKLFITKEIFSTFSTRILYMSVTFKDMQSLAITQNKMRKVSFLNNRNS